MAITLSVKIRVEDFDQWKAAFDGAEQFRKDMGIEIKGLYRSSEDDKSLLLLSDYPNREIAEKMLANPQWEENQRKAGVIGGFEVSFLHEINE